MTQLMRHIDEVTPSPPLGCEGQAAEMFDFVRTLVDSQPHMEEVAYFGKSACGTEVVVSQLEPTERAVLLVSPRVRGGILRQGWFVESCEGERGEQRLRIAAVIGRPFSGILSVSRLSKPQALTALGQVEADLTLAKDVEYFRQAHTGVTYARMLAMRSVFLVGRKSLNLPIMENNPSS